MADLLDVAATPDPKEETGIVAMIERVAANPDVPVDKLERLLAMQERILDRGARAEFYIAMAAAQKDMRPVAADADNPQTRSRYASYEALDRALRPIYTKHGFALSFNTGDAPGPDVVRVLCNVSHIAGHCEPYKADMPADGKGAKGGDVMSRTHATGAAMSYGMRYLLKMIFNVAVGEDDDDGNGASGQRAPDAPAGFDAIKEGLEDVAMKGFARLKKQWAETPEPIRNYVFKYQAQWWARVKQAAQKADKISHA